MNPRCCGRRWHELEVQIDSGLVGKPYWFACEQPERPRDEWTCYTQSCRACVIAAKTALAIEGEITLRDGQTREEGPLSDWVKDVRSPDDLSWGDVLGHSSRTGYGSPIIAPRGWEDWL